MPDAEREPGAEFREGEQFVVGNLRVQPRPLQQGLGVDILRIIENSDVSLK